MILLTPNTKNSRTSEVDLVPAIQKLKREMNAIILAHYYQVDEIQDVADFIGDSLDLSRKAADTDADVIVFCGVHFMAETAKVLSPHKTVLLPDLAAGCSLAESAPPEAFKAFVDAHPNHLVVNYVNTSAAVKALTDYCVTSSNAVQVINSLPPEQEIIFGPDKYLGDWVRRETGRDMLLWEGSCEVHEIFSEQAISEMMQENPGAKVLVHPECPGPVRDLGDVVGSTKRLLEAVANGPEDATYIVVTEPGIIHKMKEAAPKATFLMAPASVSGSEEGSCTTCNTCPHMKRNTLEKLYLCMKNRSPEIFLDEEIVRKARIPIERMIAIG
ncbi:MAG: quinolinate synthase NadA [Verrucomicrobia bacterium]|nr:quinolinate synthase NadA [Verrucomicrobiota bacterium]MCH8511020.1 quinolinate synthase NadA [Kiritimatiellia bacterium]